MSNIKFVSHEEFPEDQYTKELVYLLIDEKYRVAYVRKEAKNGGQFWGIPSVAVTKDGCKAYYECFLQDSSFLDKDIKKFLDERSWEKGSAYRSASQSHTSISKPPKGVDYMDTEIPF